MTGFAVKIDIEDAARQAAAAFAEFGLKGLPRAIQFSLTGVAIDGVNRWREAIDGGAVYRNPRRVTRNAVRYVVDKDMLARVTSVGEARAEVFVQDKQSVWMKFGFGEGANTHLPGDVGIEAWFGDQQSIRVPVGSNVAHAGLGRVNAAGEVAGRDVRAIAAAAAAGYKRNTKGGTRAGGSWGVFEVKPGDTRALNGYCYRPGIWARPPRIVAAEGRKKLKRKIAAGTAAAPTTEFTRRNGTEVSVPKVVNNDTPRLLFLQTPQATYQPVATPSWQDAMDKAAKTFPDRMAAELADKLSRLGLR